MSLLFIYSLINYYTAFSRVTLKSSLGGASSRGAARAAGQGAGVCRDTRTGQAAPPARPAVRAAPACNYEASEQTAAPGPSRLAANPG